jgi:hypothetical protein
MDEMVLVKDIPPGVIESVSQGLAAYTIAFLRSHDATRPHEADLLGTGVLVSVGSRRAILTAAHVAQELPRAGRIGVFLQRTSHVHSIDALGVSIVRIARGSDATSGPDLTVVILAPSVAGSIAVRKSFYSLDTNRERVLASALDLRDGVWLAQGFLEERTTVGPDRVEAGLTKYFYNFTGVGGPDTIDSVGDYDYLDFPVSHEARPDAPASFGGMSGGGIWQVPLKRQDGQLTHLSPVLSGVMFYQHPTTETQCGIRGHGPQSIYRAVYVAVRVTGRGDR